MPQFSSSVMSDSLQPHRLQHTMPPCSSPTPGACSNSCPSSQSNWTYVHPTISTSVVPFYYHLQSFPSPGSFSVSQFFISGGQSIGVSVSASVLPMNIQNWLLQDWLVWLPCSSRDSQESSLTPQFKSINSQPSLWSNSHPYMNTGKTISLPIYTFVDK